MKTYDEVFELTKNIMLKLFRLKEDQIIPDANIQNELNLDSLDGINFLCELESVYGRELVSEDNKEDFYKAIKSTINDLILFLMKL